MRAVLLILLLLALLIGGYLVYRNLAGQTSGEGDQTRIEAIEKARRGAGKLQRVQEEIHRRAEQASD